MALILDNAMVIWHIHGSDSEMDFGQWNGLWEDTGLDFRHRDGDWTFLWIYIAMDFGMDTGMDFHWTQALILDNSMAGHRDWFRHRHGLYKPLDFRHNAWFWTIGWISIVWILDMEMDFGHIHWFSMSLILDTAMEIGHSHWSYISMDFEIFCAFHIHWF